jgi:hypothetical protein
MPHQSHEALPRLGIDLKVKDGLGRRAPAQSRLTYKVGFQEKALLGCPLDQAGGAHGGHKGIF